MRVAIVANTHSDVARGNRRTVERWLRHLDPGEAFVVEPDPGLRLDPAPDLVHAYQLRRTGAAALAIARRHGVPLVASFGGTDLMGDDLREVVAACACLTGAFDSFRGRVGSLARAWVTVPRAVDLGPEPDPRPRTGRVEAVQPGGLRPIKDQLYAIELARRLVDAGVPLRLRLLGPALDAEYAAQVARAAASLPFVELGECDDMAAAYAGAHVVWNTSLHEGGSNALLEGLAHGCAAMARDVPGNRDYFLDGGPGTLLDGDPLAAARALHRALLDESEDEARARIRRARAWLAERHDPAREVAALRRAWTVALRDR